MLSRLEWSYSCNNIYNLCRVIFAHATETQTMKSHAGAFFLDITLFLFHSRRLPCHLVVLCACSASMFNINIHTNSHPEILAAAIYLDNDIWGESSYTGLHRARYVRQDLLTSYIFTAITIHWSVMAHEKYNAAKESSWIPITIVPSNTG